MGLICIPFGRVWVSFGPDFFLGSGNPGWSCEGGTRATAASKGKTSRVSAKPCAWVEWVESTELRTLITAYIFIPETACSSFFGLDRIELVSLAFSPLNPPGSVTSTAIILELFLTFELPQPRVAAGLTLRGPGEREEKVGQSDSNGPSAHYCPPASTEPPTDIFPFIKTDRNQ